MKKKPILILLLLFVFVFVVSLSGCTNNRKEIDIFDSLPKLKITTDEKTIAPLYLDHTWRWKNCDYVLNGNSNPFLGAPLENEKYMATLETTQSKLMIDFDNTPDNILSIICWRNVEKEIEVEIESVNYNSEMLELKKGDYIYMITAEWTDKSDENGYGQISYCFHVNAE
ncbi:MAG: hypothetical protein UH081_05355 [Clostridia bacterium]|nr:hypothetical protein [Clostridia bacterium]